MSYFLAVLSLKILLSLESAFCPFMLLLSNRLFANFSFYSTFCYFELIFSFHITSSRVCATSWQLFANKLSFATFS